MGAFLPLLNIGGTKCRSGGSVGAVIGRPFYSFTLQATNGRPYFIYNHRDVEVPSPTFTFLPPLSRLCRQLPSMGAFLPLLEERWHAVPEWWLISILYYLFSLIYYLFRTGGHRPPF